MTLSVKGDKSLMTRIEKMVAMKDDASNKKLTIRYKDKGKTFKTTKKYAKCGIVEAMKHMKGKHDELRKEFMLSFAICCQALAKISKTKDW